LGNLKRLSTIDDDIVVVQSPIPSDEITQRANNYPLLSPNQFAKKYGKQLFQPVSFQWNGKEYQIQYNFCTNPFCKWHGLPQTKFSNVKSKPSRYKLVGSTKSNSKMIKCNPDPINPTKGMTLDCTTVPLSNWSIALEIERLIRIETIKDWEPDYQFHKVDCAHLDKNPTEHPEYFYKQGKSKVGGQCWQCKTCKKKTNLLPSSKQSTSYHQQRNDILLMFTKLLLNKTPVSRTIEVLEIGVKTYYSKLEWVYRKCLEFLERHERKPIKNKDFGTVWINTDKMIYYLNNVRKKGMGGSRYDEIEDTHFPTHIIVSADVFSRYVFRSDVAYDWDIKLEDIMLDTVLLKDDHLHEYARKHARLRINYFPQEPTENDDQTLSEYRDELFKFQRREKYIDGLHTNSTYTSIAHFWLLKEMLRGKEWRFITDKDNSLMTALFRVFANEFRTTDAHHFLSLVDRTKSRKDAYNEFKQAKADLLSWGAASGYETKSLRKLAFMKLTKLFQSHQFHQELSAGTHNYHIWANNPIEHPIASIDKGFHLVDCTTDLSSYEPEQIAYMVLNVNDNASNFFIQQIRRRLSILERPLTTARGDGKSYIYSNFNPKYAQMALTVLRTYYNFCFPYKTPDGKKLTPAQRLGITDKVFKINDIIYLR